VKKLEAHINDVFLGLVMKLNDTTFRPFFINMRDWAFRGATGDARQTRQVFFYNFMNKFIDVLQTVVTAYYGIILDDTVQLLKDFASGSLRNKDLWAGAIKSLQKSFDHDLDQDCICPLTKKLICSILVLSFTL
jgi:U3 small nucleolar RNA-associated protein 10